MSDDKNEITRLVNLYIDGAGKGDASKLNEAFHLLTTSLFQFLKVVGRLLAKFSPIQVENTPNKEYADLFNL